MNYFDKQFTDVELHARQFTEEKAKAVYDVLEQRYNVGNFITTPQGSDYLSKVQTVLLDPYLGAVHSKCLDVLLEHGADMNSFLFSFINLLLMPNIPYDVALAIVRVLNSLNIYESFSLSEDSIDVSTNMGAMHLDKIDNWVKENHRLKIDRNGFAGNCHSVTQALSKYFPDYYATTVKMPAYFGGNFYHSFFTSPDNDLVVDFSVGDVVKKGDFYSILGCNEILMLPVAAVPEAYDNLCDREDVPEDMCPILALAIDNDRSR